MNISIDVSAKLIPNLWTFLSQLCATGIIFFFIGKFLWKPGREYMVKKAELTQKSLTDAEEMKKMADKDRQAARKELSLASNQAKDIVEKGKFEGTVIKDAIINDGRDQADRLLKNARAEISLEEKKMRQGIQKEIVDVAMMATEKLMVETMDEDANRKSVESMVKELTENE